jgi:hypothetical protein
MTTRDQSSNDAPVYWLALEPRSPEGSNDGNSRKIIGFRDAVVQAFRSWIGSQSQPLSSLFLAVLSARVSGSQKKYEWTGQLVVVSLEILISIDVQL